MARFDRIFDSNEAREEHPELSELALFHLIYVPFIQEKIEEGQFLDEIFAWVLESYRSSEYDYVGEVGNVHRIRAQRLAEDHELEFFNF